MWLQKIFIPIVLQGLHSGKKAQKMQQCTCVRVIFYFSKECRKEYIPPFIYYIFTKSCNFFVMSFAYFSKVLTFYRRIIAKQYVEKKKIQVRKKSMALTFAYLPASKHMHVFENTQTYIRVDKKLSEAPNTHREGFIL